MKSLISKTDKIFVAGSSGMAGSDTRALIKNGYGNTSIGGELHLRHHEMNSICWISNK